MGPVIRPQARRAGTQTTVASYSKTRGLGRPCCAAVSTARREKLQLNDSLRTRRLTDAKSFEGEGWQLLPTMCAAEVAKEVRSCGQSSGLRAPEEAAAAANEQA